MPPSVASSGFSFRPVESEIDFVIISVSSPSLLINDLALISSVKLQEAFFSLEKTSSIFFLSQSIIDSAVCSSLNLILIVAFANSGITLCAELPTSNVGTCMEVGRKYSFP